MPSPVRAVSRHRGRDPRALLRGRGAHAPVSRPLLASASPLVLLSVLLEASAAARPPRPTMLAEDGRGHRGHRRGSRASSPRPAAGGWGRHREGIRPRVRRRRRQPRPRAACASSCSPIPPRGAGWRRSCTRGYAPPRPRRVASGARALRAARRAPVDRDPARITRSRAIACLWSIATRLCRSLRVEARSGLDAERGARDHATRNGRAGAACRRADDVIWNGGEPSALGAAMRACCTRSTRALSGRTRGLNLSTP